MFLFILNYQHALIYYEFHFLTHEFKNNFNLIFSCFFLLFQQQKFLKRPADETDSGPDSFEPPNKLHNNGSEISTKFSVEIVQQLEFTTSAANSQPQQISTNVTVKALTNTSVKTEGNQNNNNQGPTNQNNNGNNNNQAANQNQKQKPSSPQVHDLGHLVECKQEPDNDFADLEQCAAALEKDAAAHGHFPGFSDLIGDDTNDESETFKELISDLSDFQADLLDFEEKPLIEIKQEDGGKQDISSHLLDNINMGKNNNSPLTQQYPSSFNDNQNLNKQRGPYNSSNGTNNAMSENTPAAQTLKHMAEQHQHKNAMGIGFSRPPQSQPNNARSPYTEYGQFQNSDFIGNNPAGQQQQQAFLKGQAPPFPGADMIKQEMIYSPQNEFDMKRIAQMQNTKMAGQQGVYKQQQQQYSPYGSPGSMPNHGSPGQNFMPQRGGPGAQQQGPTQNAPPRPPSGPGTGSHGPTTVQMKQTQQLHISQQVSGHGGIQVRFF